MSQLEKQLNSKTMKLTLFVLSGALSLFLQEALARDGAWAALAWFSEHPCFALINLLLVYAIIALFVALVGRVAPGAVIAFALLFFVALVNFEKISRLQQPFLAWDAFYYEQILALLPALSVKGVTSTILQPLGALAFVFICVLAVKEKPLKVRSRIGLLAVGSLLLATVVYHRELPKGLPTLVSVENAVWDQRSNHYRNGFLLAFTLNVQPMLIDAPQDYCEAVIHELLEGVVSQPYQIKLQSVQQPISLVLFVSESFYDVKHVRYEAEEDPLINFRELQSRFPSFRMVSPTFGGNSSNVEFEMLTGLSNAFLPAGAVPYDHYLAREVPSLPQILRDSGYRTIAIHPYYEWFWNRQEVYPRLGFDEFLSLKDFTEAGHRGWFISDEALVDRIIDAIEQSDGPYFLHAISMQNHGEYHARRYAPDEIEVRGEFPESSRLALQTYVTGLRDADRQLKRLLEHLENRPEPVITLFCGDHLPSFGAKFAVYRESGALESADGDAALEDIFKLSSVPCLLWANRDGLLDADLIPQHMSPVYFPAVLLKQLEIEMPQHFRYLLKGIDEHPVIHRRLRMETNGELADFLATKDDHPFLRGLELLQYDILFGEQHSLSGPGQAFHLL